MLRARSHSESITKCLAQGFTLVEALVVILILGILAGLAIPSFQRLVIDTRLSTQANDFLTTLHFTRSEAVKRNTRVTMCKSSDGVNCTVNGGWQQGWIVFPDEGTAGILDGTDTVLRVHGRLDGGSTFTGNQNVANFVSYMPNGQTSLANGGMQGGTIKLCSSTAGITGRDVVITMGPGRPRVQAATAGCP